MNLEMILEGNPTLEKRVETYGIYTDLNLAKADAQDLANERLSTGQRRVAKVVEIEPGIYTLGKHSTRKNVVAVLRPTAPRRNGVTIEGRKFIADNAERMTSEEIAKILGCSKWTVCRWKKALGIQGA